MALSKDEISELKSLISRVAETHLDLKMADLRKQDAQRVLENYLHALSKGA